ncbi:MAG: LLM class flavin-dependent oxidoreductase, partial [Candidatus Bathyarchaeia archaeon]
PHPPLWFGGTSDSTIRAIAKHGNGWVPYCFSPLEFKILHEKLKKALTEEGRKADEITVACVVLAHLESSSEKAYEFAKPIIKLRGTRTLTSERWGEALERSVIGSREECISKIEEYEKAGVQHLLFEMIHPKQVYRQVKKFGSIVSAFK